MMNPGTRLVLASLLLALLCLARAPEASAQPCSDGMYQIYEGKCHAPEIPFHESKCTDRGTGSTMDPFRCCCPDGYVSEPENEPENEPETGPGTDPPPGNGICGGEAAAQQTARPAVTVTVLRAFRDDVLRRHESTRDYVESYYRHSGDVTKLMLASPKLLGRTAMLLEDNLSNLADLVVDGRVTVAQSSLDRAVRLVEAYAEKAPGDSGLREVLQRVRRDLEDRDFLQSLGVHVAN